MRTLIFGPMVVQKETENVRRSYLFIEWSFANERIKSMVTQIFGQMVAH